ncbi:MarR family transcriptional regulator [Mesorhizobium sp. NBSH29]|uniref:MarR family winged helix-turn-helix transcriptional regulator n=1 Tax=Mesorhizobium sp. NBSH29 TaxID=2654249 RepID=UPI001896A506|nr:MarR family transcriptional regulator [Mesorhizobium sp. NBSH29]QPC87988.1 MarR family transcriptional regulator [Mesorhizobium sp. NBSH29]
MNKKQALPWDNPRFRNWIAVVRAEKAVVTALGKALQPLDLKLAQLDMLMNLYRHPGMSQHELARRLLVGRSNITMLLPQLEKRGLVNRENDAKDKRVMRLMLTGDGETLLMQALEVYNGLIERVMSQSSPDDCDRMGAVMTRISDMLRAD